jgi:DNA ligase 1
MLFRDLVGYLEKLEKISSRLAITDVLAELFQKFSVDESDIGVHLILGNLGPEFKTVEFQMAEKMAMRSVARVMNLEVKEVEKRYKILGDLGGVVGQVERAGKKVSVVEVYRELLKIAEDEGFESQERKVEGLSVLLSDLDNLSAKFVVRIVLGKLRLGFSAKTVLDALSVMAVGDKRIKSKLEKTYQVLPDVGLLVKMVKEKGWEEATKEVIPVIGVPIGPMLCQRIKSPKEMIAKMGMVAVEPKFDGTRIQVHFRRGKNGLVAAFTRNLKEVGWMFPELSKIEELLKADEVILDTEAVGLDEERKAVADFQTTMKRRRKHEIESMANQVPIRFCVFDVMYKDGKNLMGLSYVERRKILAETIVGGDLFQIDDYKVTDDPGVIAVYHQKMLDDGLEGVIVKKLESEYVPGRTRWRWVKMKELEKSLSKLSDTVDGVVMGFSVGKGRRAGFGIGKFLVGVRDGEQIKTITKVGTGLTDEQFRELKRRLDCLVIREKPKEYVVEKVLVPDVWVEPKLVVEIAADEITKSPNHTAGLALRFPRLVRFRDDKDINGVTTVAELGEIRKD